MKESKRTLIKAVACDLDKFSQDKRTRVLDIMQGMMLMDQMYKSGEKGDQHIETQTG